MKSIIALIWIVAVLEPGSWAANVARPKDTPGVNLIRCNATGVPVRAWCGSHTVFENRSAREGRTIDLNLIVIPATGAGKRSEPVFMLAGGPGSPATALAGFLSALVPGVEDSHDVVLVDQRGTGGSNALPCRPARSEGMLGVYLEGSISHERLRECRRLADADLTQYTTPIAMDDLDDVRAALGYDRIHLWGGSYGTRAALVYLRRHGEHVASVTLRGAIPPYEKVPLYFAKDAQAALDALLEDCADDDTCGLDYPQVREHLDTVLERLASKPVMVAFDGLDGSDEIEMTRATFAGGLLFLLYHSALASRIPAVIEDAHAGDFTSMLGAVAPFLQRLDAQLSFGMFLSVICSEDVALIRRQEIALETKGTFLGSEMVENIVGMCRQWPTAKLPTGYREPVSSDVPVLILSGEVDPTAAPRMATEIASHLPNSRHIILPGTGHVPTMPGCTGRIFAEFVNSGGSFEGIDVSCVDELERPPFPRRARREAAAAESLE